MLALWGSILESFHGRTRLRQILLCENLRAKDIQRLATACQESLKPTKTIGLIKFHDHASSTLDLQRYKNHSFCLSLRAITNLKI